MTCPPDHKHGTTTTCYTSHGCRCDTCRTNTMARRLNQRKQKAYGRGRTIIPVGDLRTHLTNLLAEGNSPKQLAQRAGVTGETITNIAKGTRTHTLSDTAARLAALTSDLPEWANIPATGTHRRIQALIRIGYSFPAVAAQLGMKHPNQLRDLLKVERVTRRTAARIVTVFEQMAMTPPPAATRYEKHSVSRSRNYAKRNGWLPPLAWDDIDNDTEPATVTNINTIDELAIELATTGNKVKLTSQERRIAVTQLHTLRLADSAIAARLHMNQRTVLRIRQELGLRANVGADGQLVAA